MLQQHTLMTVNVGLPTSLALILPEHSSGRLMLQLQVQLSAKQTTAANQRCRNQHCRLPEARERMLLWVRLGPERNVAHADAGNPDNCA